MKEVQFGEWRNALRRSQFSARQKQSFEITLRWYLGFCRRGRAEVTVQSARDFIDWAQGEKTPQPWQIEQWKEALNWFFSQAKQHRSASAKEGDRAAGVWLPSAQVPWPLWKVARGLSGEGSVPQIDTSSSYLLRRLRRASDNRFDRLVQVPICNRSAIHFKVISFPFALASLASLSPDGPLVDLPSLSLSNLVFSTRPLPTSPLSLPSEDSETR